jgi:hypothetical protein
MPFFSTTPDLVGVHKTYFFCSGGMIHEENSPLLLFVNLYLTG